MGGRVIDTLGIYLSSGAIWHIHRTVATTAGAYFLDHGLPSLFENLKNTSTNSRVPQAIPRKPGD